MLLMIAAEFVATGAWEMFWFQGLSAGKRFVPRIEAQAVESGRARMQAKANGARSRMGWRGRQIGR